MIGGRQGRFLRLTGGGLCACILSASTALGQNPRPGESTQAERALMARGFDLDTASLVELVRSGPGLEVRMDALDVLSWRPEAEVKAPLLELLHAESHRLVHRGLAVALARFGEESALEILRALMRETEHDDERVYLATTLAKLGDLEGYPLLIAALHSKDAAVRHSARYALFDLASKALALEPPLDVASMLLEALEDPEPWNRRSALNLVLNAVEGGIAAEFFLPAVRRLASSAPDPMVRERSALTLRRLEGPDDPELRKVLEELRKKHQEKQRKYHQEKQREAPEEPPP